MDKHLDKYIFDTRASGVSDEDIHKALLDEGWKEEDVSAALEANSSQVQGYTSRKRLIVFIAAGTLIIIALIPILYSELKMRYDYGNLGLSRDDQKTLSQFENLILKKNVHPEISLEVGSPNDAHGVRLVNSFSVENKNRHNIFPFLFPSGKFGYSTSQLVGGTPSLYFDEREIPIKGKASDFKEIGGKLAFLMYDPNKYNEEKDTDKRTLVYDGKEMPSLGFVNDDFREIGGKLAYSTSDRSSNEIALYYDGERVVTGPLIRTRYNSSRSFSLSYFKEIGGKIAYTTYDKTTNTGSIVYSDKEIKINGKVIDFQEIGSDLAYTYDDGVSNSIVLVYKEKEIAQGSIKFKNVGGRLAYSTTDPDTKIRTLVYDGVEIATSSDTYFNYDDIAGKIAFADSLKNVVYDGKELPIKGHLITMRTVGDKYAYFKSNGKEPGGVFFFEGKEFPYEGAFNGNNDFVEIGGKVVFTTFNIPSNFYYDGKKVGTAGQISDFLTTGSSSQITFFTTNESKDSTIFSIYEIR